MNSKGFGVKRAFSFRVSDQNITFFVILLYFSSVFVFLDNYRAKMCTLCVAGPNISSHFHKSCIFAKFPYGQGTKPRTPPHGFCVGSRFAPIIIAARHLFISPWLTSYSRFHDFINTACMWYTCCWSSSRACHPRDNTSIELLLKNKTTRNRPLIINFTPH